MSLVLRFPAEQELSLLRKVLWQAHIGHHYRQEHHEQWIILADDAQVEQAKMIVTRWLEDDHFETPVDMPSAPSTLRQILMALYGVPTTALLVVLTVGIFLLQSLWGMQVESWLSIVPLAFIKGQWWAGTLVPDTLLTGQWWRLITPIFMHFGVMHLTFNLVWIWVFGRQVEWIDGAWRWLLFTLLWGIVSNLVQYACGSPWFGGLSGVVYGLMGYVWWNARYRPKNGYQMPPWLLGISLVWIVLGMLPIPASWGWPQMGNGAHLGGLIMGIVTAWGCRHGRWRTTPVTSTEHEV